MCTLIVLDRVVPGVPLIAASNRDEYFSRPAAPPERIEPLNGDCAAFVAPKDLEAGGSWMGVNGHGLFVGLTNRPSDSRIPSRRSRGLLVVDALRRQDARQAAGEASRLGSGAYNPFNLYLADGRESFVVESGERGTRTRELDPGLHVLCNRDIDDRGVAKIDRIHRALEALDLSAPIRKLLRALASLLASHEPDAPPLERVCVHTPGYGTRSSSVVALGKDRWRYWFADGPPCATPYQNLTALLDSLQPPTLTAR